MKGRKMEDISWARIETLTYHQVDGLPGYTKVSLRGMPRLGIFRPVTASIIVKATEEELRAILTEDRE